VFYYFLVDGTILFPRIFPPFFSFVLKSLAFYLYFAGLGQLSEIPLGSAHVSCMAYISSYVLIINFFLFTFFWISVELPIFVEDPQGASVILTSPEPALEREPLDLIEWAIEFASDENRERFLQESGTPIPPKEYLEVYRLQKAQALLAAKL
jgi:hypothetical protein